MCNEDVSLAGIERQIASTTRDLRELIGQAATSSGPMSGDIVSQLIEDRAARLESLITQRDQLLRSQVQPSEPD